MLALPLMAESSMDVMLLLAALVILAAASQWLA